MSKDPATLTLQALPEDKRLLLAVSGGVDSMVLLDICARASQIKRSDLAVVHLNHGLRDTARRDENHVQSVCATLNIPCYSRSASLPGNVNTEAAARRARYAFFSEVCEQHGYQYIATAHTASDVVETFLMRVLSNKEPRSIQFLDEERRLIRPMLAISRAQVMQYAESHQVAYHDDESNFDTRFLRNRVRHNLLPFLASEFNENIESLLLDRAFAAAEDIEALEQVVQTASAGFMKEDFGSRKWLSQLRQIIAELPAVLSWRIVERAFYHKLRFNLGRKHSERVLAVVQGEVVAAEIPGGFRLARKRGGISFEEID